jgi:hypothetical protein
MAAAAAAAAAGVQLVCICTAAPSTSHVTMSAALLKRMTLVQMNTLLPAEGPYLAAG